MGGLTGRADTDWVSYWRSPVDAVEAMHAHFERHVYHRHSHDSYSFGVTETGAQAFTCRGAARTSAAGMVMAFNPDEPHDGHAATEAGFRYKIVHIGPELVAEVLASTGRPVGLPLFVEPVQPDPALARAVRRLHGVLESGEPLRTEEAIGAAVLALVARGSVSGAQPPVTRIPAGVRRARELLHASYASGVGSAELAETAGCSRFVLHRAFLAAYGLAPSDYQRQLRLRAARRLLAEGRSPAQVAVDTGFADQSHLNRWFTRCYGISPGRYRAAGPS